MIPLLQRELSLDAVVGREHEYRLEDFLADPKAVDPLQQIHTYEVQTAVTRALRALSARERYIIRSRFGLRGGEGKTLEQIGDDLSLSRERIRQLESAAKNALRARLALFDNATTAHTMRNVNP
jgi:RNA polymerase sigma factor (sigma-70 family)